MLGAMRFSPILAALILAACATAPQQASTPSEREASPPAASELASMLQAAGRADAPSQAMVERAFGAPDLTRRDGAGAAATYRLDTCALLLLFTPDARGDMRLAEAHASARRSGEAAPGLEQCAAEAEARAGS
jgi:hypothetical protein